MQGKIKQWVSACGNDAVPSPGSAPSAGTALGSVPARSMAWWEVGSPSQPQAAATAFRKKSQQICTLEKAEELERRH